MLDKKLVMTFLARGIGVCVLLYVAALLWVLQGPFLACCPINFGPPTATSTQASNRAANAVTRDYHAPATYTGAAQSSLLDKATRAP